MDKNVSLKIKLCRLRLIDFCGFAAGVSDRMWLGKFNGKFHIFRLVAPSSKQSRYRALCNSLHFIWSIRPFHTFSYSSVFVVSRRLRVSSPIRFKMGIWRKFKKKLHTQIFSLFTLFVHIFNQLVFELQRVLLQKCICAVYFFVQLQIFSYLSSSNMKVEKFRLILVS